MLEKTWQRLVKESLIDIYRNPQTKYAFNFPVYYFGANEDLESLGLAVQSLQAIPTIPWPDNECIILAEDIISSLVNKEVQGLIWMIHAKNRQERESIIAGSVFLINNQIIHTPPKDYRLLHLPVNTENWIFKDFEKFVEQHSLQISRAMGVVESDKYKEYLRRTLVSTAGENHWLAISHENIPMPGLAADFLSYLSNLAVPSSYMMRVHFNKGFGPTGEMKRLTKNRPIFTVIPYDRLCRQSQVLPASMREVSPHFRRGHIRHLWKEAGIDRFNLPLDPKERLKIVHQNLVKRIYVHPAWIGASEFQLDDVSFEIITGESNLNQI